MTKRVASQIDVQHSPAGEARDVWAEFRQVERITVELTQSYKYTLGRYSRFFIELENERFMATRCAVCGRVYAPPRPLCPKCLKVTGWVALSGRGEVKTYSVLHFSPDSNADVRALETPYIFAYVLLDGADTLFPHLLKVPLPEVRVGMRVKVVYSRQPVSHPIHLMYFAAEEL